MKSVLLVLLCLGCGAAETSDPFPLEPAELPLIVAEGDSITASEGTWARQLEAETRVVNVATPGDRLRVMVDDAPSQVDVHYEPGAIATLFAGTNDLKAFDVEPEWLIWRTQQWVQGRVAVGFKVAVFTMLPRGHLTEKQQATRNAFNAQLEAAVPEAIVVDVCEPPGAPSSAPMWRSDGVHPTPEGQAWMLEERIRPALEGLAKR